MLDAVAGLVEHELAVRETDKKNRLLRKAAFPAVKAIDDFDFADDKLAAAAVDRIIHHGRLVEFGGNSRRVEGSLTLGNAGRER